MLPNNFLLFCITARIGSFVPAASQCSPRRRQTCHTWRLAGDQLSFYLIFNFIKIHSVKLQTLQKMQVCQVCPDLSWFVLTTKNLLLSGFFVFKHLIGAGDFQKLLMSVLRTLICSAIAMHGAL